jgi:CBS domain-containing protein
VNAAEICQRRVITATRDTTLSDAAKLMRQHHVGCLIVVDVTDGQRRPVGVVTDRDLVIEVIANEVPVNTVTVGDIMTFALLKVSESENIMEVAQRMRSRGVRRVPVVTETTGELLGIIAMDDILRLLSEELSLLSAITAREAEQELAKRTKSPC